MEDNTVMETVSIQHMYDQLPATIRKKLEELVSVFIAENQKLNLSAHRTKERVWEGNVMDSLIGVEYLQQFSIFNFQFSILDLGTGGGFPLLPLAILFPEHRFTGLDSVRKKMDAVGRIVAALDLPNVTVVTGRAEECGRDPAHREKYDIVTVRAVAEVSILLEYCTPFVKVGGKILLWKSMDTHEEISAASRAETKLYLRRNPPISYDLGNDWGKRQILVYEKIKSTPKEYPRAVGLAKKNPL